MIPQWLWLSQVCLVSGTLNRYYNWAGLLVLTGQLLRKQFYFFWGADLGKLAKPSHQTVLERVLGFRNQSKQLLRTQF